MVDLEVLPSGHERSEAQIRPLIRFGLALIIVAALVLLAMRWLFDRLSLRSLANDQPLHPLALEREFPPAPRLQMTPSLDREEHERRQSQELSTYAWIDRDAGIVRVPIERAIELTLKQGLPTAAEKNR